MSYYNNNNNSYELSNFNSTGNSNPYQTQTQTQTQAYGSPYDNSYPPSGSAQPQSSTAGFFQQVQGVNEEIDAYNSLVQRISSSHHKILNEVNPNNKNSLERELDNLSAQASQQQASIKSHMESIFKVAGGDSAREAQASTLKENFMQSIQRYQSVEDSYRTKTKEQALRQVYIVNPNISAQEANEVVETGGQQIFSDYLTNSNVRGQAQSALNEVEVRHRELLKIQKQMQELNQLFKEVEFLVAENHEQIKQVDNYVEKSKVNVDQGNQKLDNALIKAKKSRKKKCWCLWITILIIIIIIAVVVGVVVSEVKKN